MSHWRTQMAVNQLTRGMKWRGRIRIIVFAFPVLCLIAAAGFAFEALLFQARSVPVTGTVVQVYEWPGETVFDRGRVNYEPIFTYEMNGEERRASVGMSSPAFAMAVGESATIRAIPESRGNVRIDSFDGLWALPAILAAIGAASLVVAGLLWFGLTRVFWKEPSA